MKYELPLSIRQLTGCDTFEQIEKYILTMKQYAELGEKVVNEVDECSNISTLGYRVSKLVNELNSINGTE